MARPTRSPSHAFLVTLAVLLALFHAILGTTAKIGTSVTFDEIAHLTAGHVYNERGDFRLHPENGNLPQRWAALPMQWIDPRLPPEPDNPDWERASVWGVGREFFYRSGNNTDLMIFCGRAMISLFSAGTGLLIFFWSRRLFGWTGAFFSLGLFVFCPSFLAHGALATSDATMTFFFLAAVSAWWWQLERPGMWPLLFSSVVFGLACVAKFSAALLVPMMLLLAALHVVRALRERRPLRPLVGRLVFSIGVHAFLAVAVIWAFFNFRYSITPGAPNALRLLFAWETVLEDPGLAPRLAELARDGRLLPEGFVYGFAFVSKFARNRIAFLNGDLGTEGWLEFFPFAFLVKTPLPVLLLCAVGVVLALLHLVRSGPPGRAAFVQRIWNTAPLWVLFAIYWAAALSSNLNIGHRHILPTYPVLFILLGALPLLLGGPRRLGLVALGAALAWQAVEAVRIHPHHLAYFNPIVGGPKNGYWHLVDSSLDWGQDLPGLSRWLRANRSPGETVYLEYFGMGDPAYEGISSRRLAGRMEEALPNPWEPLQPGLYCVSATALQQPQPFARRGWGPGLEAAYQGLRGLAERVRDPAGGPAAVAESEGMTSATLSALGNDYARLRFQRLCSYLRVRQPEAAIGYSIFVHRLTESEIQTATEEPPANLVRLIESASAARDR